LYITISDDFLDANMGRKKIPNSARKQVITCSLKPVTIREIDEAIPPRMNRSKWIEQAIHAKLNHVGNPNKFSNKKLLAMIHGRITHCIHKNTDIDREHWQMSSDMTYMLDQIALLHQEYLELKK